MPERNVVIAIFYDGKENIIFQERGSASKIGEKYGFWGGQIEAGETPELEAAEVHEGKGMIKMTIDEVIASHGFSIGGIEFLKIIKKKLYGRED